jgi:undecaprenyl-diphosphatase
MNVSQAIFLGAVQGITEFFPVSSSGHLVFFQSLFGLKGDTLAFDIVVHWGTLLAVFIYFWKDIFALAKDTLLFSVRWPFKRNRAALFEAYPHALTGFFVMLTTVATGIMAFAFKEIFEFMFNSMLTVGGAWLVTGVCLILSRRFQYGQRGLLEMNHQDAFMIGLIQGIAIMPGISRSGATIMIAMYLGLERESAARYSFFAAIPAILGAGVLEMNETISFYNANTPCFLTGLVVSAILGCVGIHFLLKIVRAEKYHYFGYYCLVMAAVALSCSILRRFGV